MYPCIKLAVPDEMVVPVQSKLSLWEVVPNTQ